MGRISTIINNLTQKNYFSNYLPIFRIYVCFHIIKKTYLGWGSISLVYGDLIDAKSPIIKVFPLDYSIGNIPVIMILTIALSLLFAFGIGKRLTIFLLFLCIYFNSELIYLYSNGGDNLLTYICLYLIFANSYDFFSFKRLEYKSEKLNNISNLVSNLAVYSIMIHLCMVYFVSFIHKIHSEVWFNGVATYYILNLERYSSPFNHLFAKNAFFIAFSTYFTLAFELFFPILVWNKKFRNLLLVSGILLHLGIYFFMMIYDFEILFIMIYGFFLTNQEWKRLFLKLKNKINFNQIKLINTYEKS